MPERPRGLLVTLVGAAVVIAAAFYFGFQDQKDDAETSRLFLPHIAAGEAAEAHALLHVSITDQYSVEDLARATEGLEVYTDIRFPSFSWSNSIGARISELGGTATTDSGCESDLIFENLNGKITRFNISPLCGVETTGADDA